MSTRPHQIKQVIVARSDTGMNMGKLAAQAAHASMGAFIPRETTVLTRQADGNYLLQALISPEAAQWFEELSVKAVLKVPSEAALLDVFEKAQAAGLPCVLIKDAGLTHFSEPTLTAVGIGPANGDAINAITGHLPLFRKAEIRD